MHYLLMWLWLNFFFTLFCGVIVQGQSSINKNYNINNDRGDDAEMTERNSNSVICMDISPQGNVTIEQITGQRWYGHEIIMHTQDVPGVYRYADSCVVIQITDITNQMQDYHYGSNSRRTNVNNHYLTNQQQNGSHTERNGQVQNMRYLRLVWTESDNTIEYIFSYKNESQGHWTNMGDLRGSFKGTVQVLKPNNEQLVLTFCENDVKSSIYTIVLSRNFKGLSPKDIASIHGLLEQRHLSTDTIRKICSSKASKWLPTSIIMFLILSIASLYF